MVEGLGMIFFFFMFLYMFLLSEKYFYLVIYTLAYNNMVVVGVTTNSCGACALRFLKMSLT